MAVQAQEVRERKLGEQGILQVQVHRREIMVVVLFPIQVLVRRAAEELHLSAQTLGPAKMEVTVVRVQRLL